MFWSRAGVPSAPPTPAASVSPERHDTDRVPRWPATEAFDLIDVACIQGGYWKAVCECGEAPHVFAEERAAWFWVTSHTCPVLETDTRPV